MKAQTLEVRVKEANKLLDKIKKEYQLNVASELTVNPNQISSKVVFIDLCPASEAKKKP